MGKNETYSDSGNRLEEFRIGLGLNKREFSVRIGINRADYSKYLKGELNLERLFFALQNEGADVQYIRTGKKREGQALQEIPIMQVPVYEYVHAGDKHAIPLEPIINYTAIPRMNDQTLFGVKVRGDCMEPMVSEGDIIILSRLQEPVNGDLCLIAFNNDDEYILRHVYFYDHTVTALALNNTYPPMSFSKSHINSILPVVHLMKGRNQLRINKKG